MRYFDFSIAANAQLIQEKATIRLKDYDYDSPIGAMNLYMYRTLKNGLLFAAYREEENVTRAVFAFDEKRWSLADAYESIVLILGSVFGVKCTAAEPEEITLHEFYNCGMEGKRRCFSVRFGMQIDDWVLTVFNYNQEAKAGVGFGFDEFLIPAKPPVRHDIFDGGFIKELENVDAHAAELRESGVNVVHYFISARSRAAACDMAGTLAHSLFKAGRVSSRRVSVIHDIDPDFYKTANSNCFENVIENSRGGVILIDLAAKFGRNPFEYVMAGKYIVNTFRQYCSGCLFIFTYDINDPGFSYQVLPEIKKYAVPVMLREGTGDRKAAVKYLAHLIRGSASAPYAKQAREYLKGFPGERFSQTAVLEAFEQFEPWCINRNVLKAYDTDVSAELMLDRDENAASPYDRLQKLIGLENVKRQIDEIIAANLVWKERKRRGGSTSGLGSMHMVFAGNPGTAKTTVARLFAGIGKEKGLLRSGVFVERGGMDLNGFTGSVRSVFTEASGGVLFIDEAYAMFADDCIATLIQEMAEHRDDVIVILAGYSGAMEQFMRRNEGLKSRIPNWIEFPDYSPEELMEIFRCTVSSLGFSVDEDAVIEARCIFEKACSVEDFGNGRYVRSLVERAIRNQSMRLFKSKNDVTKIPKDVLFLITKEDVLAAEGCAAAERREPGTALKELENMVGLDSVKEVIRKAVSNYKLSKLCVERGIQRKKASMHMVFTGNPGTAKTTVARLFAEILKDEKVLPTGKFVEVGRADLVGRFVGSTAPLVKKRFREAKGGVLFIDEAYSLCDGFENGFGDEAINTIVQEMENNREDTVVIFAGYPEPMREFLERNPGMQSRVAFRVEFEDYSTDELCRITALIAKQQGRRITDAAMEKLRGIYETVRSEPGFGNGRFVRKMLEEAGMNLAQRLLPLSSGEITEKLITTVEEIDIPTITPKEGNKANTKHRIGFGSGED